MKDLASHIMDITQNSVRAKASEIEIVIDENLTEDRLSITIQDNGCGMDEETLKRVRDPFFTSRTVRKVGLGIPLLQQNAERTGGKVNITSEKGEGTVIEAIFGYTHLDRPPLGDVAGTIGLLVMANPEIVFRYSHSSPKGEFHFDTEEVKAILEGLPINTPEIIRGIEEMIRENEKEIKEI